MNFKWRIPSDIDSGLLPPSWFGDWKRLLTLYEGWNPSYRPRINSENDCVITHYIRHRSEKPVLNRLGGPVKRELFQRFIYYDSSPARLIIDSRNDNIQHIPCICSTHNASDRPCKVRRHPSGKARVLSNISQIRTRRINLHNCHRTIEL